MAILANLKCCKPNGIPIMVIQNKKPITQWDITMGIPPVTSHNKFIIIYKQPEALWCALVVRPNGQIANDANFNVCIPNGIPMIVNINIKLPIIYSIEINNPPKRTQIIFPINFILM